MQTRGKRQRTAKAVRFLNNAFHIDSGVLGILHRFMRPLDWFMFCTAFDYPTEYTAKKTLFGWAVDYGELPVLEWVMENIVKFKWKDNAYWVSRAATRGNLDILQFLCESGYKVGYYASCDVTDGAGNLNCLLYLCNSKKCTTGILTLGGHVSLLKWYDNGCPGLTVSFATSNEAELTVAIELDRAEGVEYIRNYWHDFRYKRYQSHDFLWKGLVKYKMPVARIDIDEVFSVFMYRDLLYRAILNGAVLTNEAKEDVLRWVNLPDNVLAALRGGQGN